MSSTTKPAANTYSSILNEVRALDEEKRKALFIIEHKHQIHDLQFSKFEAATLKGKCDELTGKLRLIDEKKTTLQRELRRLTEEVTSEKIKDPSLDINEARSWARNKLDKLVANSG